LAEGQRHSRNGRQSELHLRDRQIPVFMYMVYDVYFDPVPVMVTKELLSHTCFAIVIFYISVYST
jgi:hypothetical protein